MNRGSIDSIPVMGLRNSDNAWTSISAGQISLILLVIGLVAFWFRIRNLGVLPMMGDEAIQAMAVRGVLEHGIPLLESGVVYTRALLYTYVQSSLLGVFDLPSNEFWLRFPGVVFGTLVIVPVYALARQFGDQRVAVIAALFIALSTWEIELSRYARFYTLFQLAFVTSVYCFYRGFLRDQAGWRCAFLLACFIAFFSHYLSLILFSLFLIPFATRDHPNRRTVIWGIALAVLWYVHKGVRLWIAGMGPTFEPRHVLSRGGDELWGFLSLFRVGLPNLYRPNWLPLLDMYAFHPLLIWVLILLSVSSLVVILYRSKAQSWLQVLTTGLAVVLAMFYQFGLVALLYAILVIWVRTDWKKLLSSRQFLDGLAVCGALFLFWLLVFANILGEWKVIVLIMFGVPNFLQHFAYWFALGWPILSSVVVTYALLLLFRYLTDRKKFFPIFLPASVLVPAIGASFFQAYYESRYVFHLYPAMVIMYSLAIVGCADFVIRRLDVSASLSRGAVTVGILAGMLVCSQDASPELSWRIADRNFGSKRDSFRSVISWPLYAGFDADRELPAEYVHFHRREEDRVLTLGPIFMHTQYHYYAKGVDALINPVNSPNAYSRRLDGVLINYVTGAEIVSGKEEILEYIREAPGTVWILGDTLLLRTDTDYYSENVKKILIELTDKPVFLGRDGISFLAKVSPKNLVDQPQGGG